jgi:hypothetical protein
MASTDLILAILGERKSSPTEVLQNEVSESLDAPRLSLKPGADMSNELTRILGSSMSQQSTPMD